MSFKKKIMVAAAAATLTAGMAVPAMALENEFHGMYRFMGYESNFFTGEGQAISDNDHSGFFAEQRARLQYIAKANDNLKLVTQFELDARFGGKSGRYLGTQDGNDAGQLDADSLTLETKNVYLDFNAVGTNFKVGIQPWADSYKSIFLLADMAGVVATKKVIDPLTVSLGWFRIDDNSTNTSTAAGKLTTDLIALDAKYAVNKDLTVGASYYNVQNDSGLVGYELLHMVGVNAAAKFGPAAVDVFGAYQFGDGAGNTDIGAYLLGATAKIKAGPGAVNLAAVYLSGDDNGTGDNDDFKIIGANTSYFNQANMWLLIRSGQAINSSSSVLGNDLTVGGRGLLGVFAGYEGTVDKLFYNANVGYAQAAESRGAEEEAIGTEINVQVGYKLYDNLSVSLAGAYLIAGDGLAGTATERFSSTIGGTNADNPYMVNAQVSYTF